MVGKMLCSWCLLVPRLKGSKVGLKGVEIVMKANLKELLVLRGVVCSLNMLILIQILIFTNNSHNYEIISSFKNNNSNYNKYNILKAMFKYHFKEKIN